MSVRFITRILFSILWLTILFSTSLQAQSNDPLSAHIDDPIFLKVPSASGNVETKDGFTLDFNYDRNRCRSYYGDNYYRGCQRRLGLDGKKADAGISITPPIAGEWRWQSDYTLFFTPSEYWQAGENYTVALDLDALNVPDNIVLGQGQRQATISFQTRPLTVSFPEMNYMQDPDDPDRKLVSARLTMNYPVEQKKLEEKIRLEMEEESGGKLKLVTDDELAYEIQYDPDALAAWVAVPIKTLPDKDRYLRLLADPGLESRHGGQASRQTFTERARIPTLTSHLAINNASASIARAEDGTPQQILSFETNVKARPQDALGMVKLYLLPEQHPVTKRSKSKASPDDFYEWNAANEVTPDILKQSEVLTLQPMKDAKDHVTQFGFPISAPTGRYLYLVIGEDMKAFGGYVLGRSFETILKVPEWPNDIQIMQDGSILTLSGARKLSLHARGTDKLQIEVAHIRTEALQHFISQTSGDIRSPSFRNWLFDKEDIAQLDTKDVPMNYKLPQESQYAAFDFSPYLKDGGKGLFLLDIRGYREDKPAGQTQQRFVLVTDMGLLVKQGGNDSRDVYLVSFTNGKPVAEATVSVLGRNGLSVFDGKTDREGHITLPDLSGFIRDREPVAITAQKKDDYTFIPYDRGDRLLNLSQFDVGGAVTAAEGMNAFLFSDRGIYRPGETVHIAALVRNADWTLLPPDLPLQVVITDPRGRTIQDTILKFPAAGLQEVSLDTGESWPTGTYRARLHISDDGQPGSLLGNTSFRVEEFQPDRLKIKTVFSRESHGWVKPEELEATVTLTNLYGTPATDRRITAAVTLNPANMTFETYKNYKFYDSRTAKARTIQYDLPETKTDVEGKATLKLDLERQEAATYSLNLETRGFEAGSGRGVASYATMMVSPMDYAIGYKTESNIHYLRKGQKYSINLLAVGPDLEPIDAAGLTLDLVRRTYVSTLVKRSDGSYAYESVPREETVKSESFAIAAAGTDLALPTGEIGTYSWRLKDTAGLTIADIPFSVAGEGQRSTGADREAVLDVRINKKTYGPGESVELNITAPYTGAGLITLESDHVIAHKWFRTDKTDTIQSIAIPDDFSGKGYVSVAFVRDINSREIYLKPLSYAVVPFIANTEARTVTIDLDVPKVVKPGEPVTVTYRGNAKGKAIIYAVDEGILQIARYKTPDPIEFFLLNRALQVSTAQMLDLLMPEYDIMRELSAKGGDAAAQGAVLGKHLNPFKRKTLAPAVYWSGIVDLDTVDKTITFTPPGHFNGQMRVMAAAVSDKGVGNAEKDMTVQGDLILTPNLPLFMAPGDEAEVSVTIANNIGMSGEGAEISLSVAPDTRFTVSGVPENLTIPEGQEKTVSFTIKAAETLGPAELLVRAGHGETTQETKATFSIRPPVALETTLTAGYAEKGKTKIKLTRAIYEESGKKEAALSPLPTSYIYGLLRYLDGFAYGCTEQLVSKVFPQMSLYRQPEFLISEDAMKDKVWQAVSTLRQRQTQEGGFSLWDGGNDPEDFITVYALDFLVRAQEESLPVPAEMVENGLRYLRNWINEDVKSMDDARSKAYGIYVLTRSGIVTTNEILQLLKYFEDEKKTAWKTDLAAVYIAASYKMMQQTALADRTMDDFEDGAFAQEITYKQADWESFWYNPFTKYAQHISLLARHFPERMAKLDPKIIFTLAAYIQEQRYSTISSSYAIQALQDYAASEKSDMAARKLAVEIDDKKIALQSTNPVFNVPVTAKEIQFRDGGKPIFYTVTETGFDRNMPAEPVAQNIEIERQYQNLDGSSVGESVGLGDIIEAVIKIRSHDNLYIDNVAIVDLLPGGFDLDLDSRGTGAGMDFIDKREDRIIAFGRVSPSEQTFRYRMRATAKGKFVTPPPFAEAMYDLTTKARGHAGEIVITDPQ